MARLPSAYNQRPMRRPAPPKNVGSVAIVPQVEQKIEEVEKFMDEPVPVEPEESAPAVSEESVSKDSLQGMTKAALSKKVADLGLQAASGVRKDELIRIICEHLNLT